MAYQIGSSMFGKRRMWLPGTIMMRSLILALFGCLLLLSSELRVMLAAPPA